MSEPQYHLCQYKDDMKNLQQFQGRVLSSLQNIEDQIKENKDIGRVERKDLWEAISDLRKDIKNLYWRIGFIAGGVALVVSIILGLIKNGRQ